jgi:hypothetical protein
MAESTVVKDPVALLHEQHRPGEDTATHRRIHFALNGFETHTTALSDQPSALSMNDRMRCPISRYLSADS